MLVKKEHNVFRDMDKIYLNNFSFNNLAEKVEQLKEKFNENIILDYFLMRADISAIDNLALKYAYPIFLLSNEVLEENSEKIVNLLSKEALDWFIEKIGKEKISFLLNGYTLRKIKSSYAVSCHEFKNFMIYEFSKGEINNEKIQIEIANKFNHFIKESLWSNQKDFDNYFCNNIDNFLYHNKFIDIRDEIWQENMRFIIFNPKFSTNTIDKILGKILSDKTLDLIIEYFNNLKKPTGRDFHIFEKIYERLFKYNFNNINLKKILPQMKTNKIFNWVKLLNKVKEYDNKENYEKYVLDYCEYITKSIKNKTNLVKIYHDTSYNIAAYINFLSEFNFTNLINDLILIVLENIENLKLKAHKDYYLTNSNESCYNSILCNHLFNLFMRFIKNNSEYEKIFDDVFMNSENQRLVENTAIYLQLVPNHSIKAWTKIEQLLENQMTDLNIQLIIYLIKSLNIIEQEDKFNILINLDIPRIKKTCNDVIAKQLFSNLNIKVNEL